MKNRLAMALIAGTVVLLMSVGLILFRERGPVSPTARIYYERAKAAESTGTREGYERAIIEWKGVRAVDPDFFEKHKEHFQMLVTKAPYMPSKDAVVRERDE